LRYQYRLNGYIRRSVYAYGKNPVGKIILSTFYPSWSAAVNDLTRTMTNREYTEGLIFRGFCGLVRMGAN
ncbi:hypothetical protein UQ93_22075, partial [Shigella dysenteriae]